MVCCLLLPGTLEVLLERRRGRGARKIVKQLSWLELHCSAFQTPTLKPGKCPAEPPVFLPLERLLNSARPQQYVLFCFGARASSVFSVVVALCSLHRVPKFKFKPSTGVNKAVKPECSH